MRAPCAGSARYRSRRSVEALIGAPIVAVLCHHCYYWHAFEVEISEFQRFTPSEAAAVKSYFGSVVEADSTPPAAAAGPFDFGPMLRQLRTAR